MLGKTFSRLVDIYAPLLFYVNCKQMNHIPVHHDERCLDIVGHGKFYSSFILNKVALGMTENEINNMIDEVANKIMEKYFEI